MAMMHEDIAGQVEAMIAETTNMTAFTKNPATMDDPDGLAERLTTMNVFLARSGEIYATAKLLLTEQTAQIYAVLGEELRAMKATEARRIVNEKTRRTDFLINLSERLNHNLVHEGNNIRRQLQYLGDQMRTMPST